MKSLISSSKRNKPKTFIIRRVIGHSMVPTLPPNTLIFAHGLIRRLKPGNIIIFRHEGKEKIKRISEVRADGVFVLGDHMDASTDSRHFGRVATDKVIAKVFWPR